MSLSHRIHDLGTRARARLDAVPRPHLGPRGQRIWRAVRWPVAAISLLLVLTLGYLVFLFATLDLPSALPDQEASSIVLSADGTEIATVRGDEYRRPVPLDEIPEHVQDAVLASEDRRFYDHGGIDPVGIVRALVSNVRGGEIQGASTLTQQLVKNEFLSSERSLDRKVREAVLASKLERTLSKDEILERYLNSVYFGRGAYGIQAAALVYFDKPASELTVAEAAYLAGILDAPEAADPLDDPERAVDERNQVLSAMVEEAMLDADEAEAIAAEPVQTTDRTDAPVFTEGVGEHFVMWVRSQVDDLIGEGASTSEGLVIETTLDLDDQRAAEQAVAEVLDQPEDPEAALVAVDETGAVRAMVGSRDFTEVQVNQALGADGGGTGRQAGSTFKPFVLAATIEDDVPLRQNWSAPASITVNVDGEEWSVTNYGGSAYGTIDGLEATAQSVNTVYAQMMAEVGPEKVAGLATELGITADVPEVPALALGAVEVSPLDMAGSFMSFARRGERVDPFAITAIRSGDGDVLYEAEEESRRVMAQEDADTVNHALQQVVTNGTGTAARLDRPVAGKTGTTQDYGDAWFVGYTPNYAAAVWMGYPEGQARSMTDVHGRNVTGGTLPAEIWQRFMTIALEDVDEVAFVAPPDEVLEDPDPDPRLSVDPARGPAGSDIRVSGVGFAPCTSAWWVTFGQSEPIGRESGSDDNARSVTVEVPGDANPGEVVITAWCDRVDGAEAVATATFTITDDPDRGDPEESDGSDTGSTTTSTSTTSTSTTSTSTTTSSTTSPTSTTTTTVPE